MNRASFFLLGCLSLTGTTVADEPVAQAIATQTNRLASAYLCESVKGDRSPFGLAMSTQCRNRQRAEFDAIQDQKPLRDCMKPGNVIDDDVRKCMKGL